MHFHLAITLLLAAAAQDIADERSTLLEAPVAEIREHLERFIEDRNLTGGDSLRIMDILRFGDFVGTDIGGTPVNYSDPELPGYRPVRVALYGYYAEWCPNCRRNLPDLIGLYEKHRAGGLAVALSFMYSDPARVRAYAEENTIPFPVLIGSEDRENNPDVRLETTHYILRSVFEDYRRWGTPFYILYDADRADTWYIVAGEFIVEEIDAFLSHLLASPP
jgi:thiol-disulfide isomerase/thioredoxin